MPIYGISNLYQVDYYLELKGCWVVIVIYIFIKKFKGTFFNKQWRPDQTSCFVESDLGLHCLPLSHKRTLSLYGLNKANYFYTEAYMLGFHLSINCVI